MLVEDSEKKVQQILVPGHEMKLGGNKIIFDFFLQRKNTTANFLHYPFSFKMLVEVSQKVLQNQSLGLNWVILFWFCQTL